MIQFIKNDDRLQKGFSLIEVTIVVFFTVILTTITVYNYRNFDSGIELKNQAIEIALTIREAQVSALSSRGSDVSDPDTFRYSYGVFFDDTHSGSYMFFVNSIATSSFWFDDSDWSCTSASGDECIKRYDLQTGYTISDICIPETDCVTAQNDASVSFKRPDPEAVIRDQDGSSTNLNSVKIELSSPKGKKKYIHVTQAGQIYVE